jgi:hypothetical protein
VVGVDGTVYKCSVDFENENNKVGKLLPNGRLDLNSNWIYGSVKISVNMKCAMNALFIHCARVNTARRNQLSE